MARKAAREGRHARRQGDYTDKEAVQEYLKAAKRI